MPLMFFCICSQMLDSGNVNMGLICSVGMGPPPTQNDEMCDDP
jgi:hypothetical protein